MSSVAKSVFVETHITTGKYTVDYCLLDANVMNALTDIQPIDVENDREAKDDHDVNSSITDATLDNGVGLTVVKFSKVSVHESIALDVMRLRLEKMNSMNLPVVRH